MTWGNGRNQSRSPAQHLVSMYTALNLLHQLKERRPEMSRFNLSVLIIIDNSFRLPKLYSGGLYGLWWWARCENTQLQKCKFITTKTMLVSQHYLNKHNWRIKDCQSLPYNAHNVTS